MKVQDFAYQVSVRTMELLEKHQHYKINDETRKKITDEIIKSVDDLIKKS
jgi:hypothetical protein